MMCQWPEAASSPASNNALAWLAVHRHWRGLLDIHRVCFAVTRDVCSIWLTKTGVCRLSNGVTGTY